MRLRKNVAKINGMLLGGGLFALALFVALPTSAGRVAHADATPDSCFYTFTVAENVVMISGYDGSCGENVEIPDVIGGKSVIGVMDMSFVHTHVRSVKIPASVTYIDSQAFAYNNISSVYIAGDPTIGSNAFYRNGDQDAMNQCDYQYLDDDYQISAADAPSYIACMQSALEVVRIYAPATSGNVKDLPYTQEFYTDSAGEISFPAGGQIVNPASLTLLYRDQKSGAELRAPDTYVGKNLLSYKVSDNPTNDFSLYYRAGDAVTYSAPKIDGYDATGETSQKITLSADPSSPNSLTFDYVKAEKSSENSENPNANTATKTPLLVAPNTGVLPTDR